MAVKTVPMSQGPPPTIAVATPQVTTLPDPPRAPGPAPTGVPPPNSPRPSTIATSTNPKIVKSLADLDHLGIEAKPDKPPEDDQKPPAKASEDAGDTVEGAGNDDASKATPAPTDDGEDPIDALTKPPAKPSDEPEARTPKELRKAYETTKGERDQLRVERDQLRKAVEELKAGKANPEFETLKTEYETLKTRHQELRDQLDLTEETGSPEFKERYVKPLESAYKAAEEDIVRLMRATDEQPATPADLKAILNMDRVSALKRISEMFHGEGKDIMVHHYFELEKQSKAWQQGINQFKESVEARRIKMAEQARAQQEAVTKQFKAHYESIARDYAELFGPTEGDKEGNELLEKGKRLAEVALNGSEYIKPEQFTKILAAAYHRVAGFDRMYSRAVKSEKRIAELEAKLKRYEKSEPATGSSAAIPGDGTVSYKTPMQKALAGLQGD